MQPVAKLIVDVVTRETDGIPPPLRNSTGTIYLGYQETEDGGEHLATGKDGPSSHFRRFS